MRRAVLPLLAVAVATMLCGLCVGAVSSRGSILPAALVALDSATTAGTLVGSIDRAFDDDSVGFHRTLITRIVLDRRPSAPGTTCSVLLRESLPSTFYFDLYQLEGCTRFQSASPSGEPVVRVFSEHDVELERSAEVSREHTVWMLATQLNWKATSDSSDLSTTIRVPIHARYQAARFDATHAVATIGPPQVFVRCSASSASDKLLSSAAEWTRVNLPASSPSVQMQVPVGDLADLAMVRFGTFIVTMGAAVALCATVWWKQASDDASDKHAD